MKTYRSMFRSVSKHEKYTLIVGIIAVVLLFLSCFLYGDNIWGEVLQGLATGLLSGVVLLFVNGLKNQELRELSEKVEIYHSIMRELDLINESYASFYHMTYHGKKKSMDPSIYLDKIYNIYKFYNSSSKKILELSKELKEESALTHRINEYALDLESTYLLFEKNMHRISNETVPSKDLESVLDLIAEKNTISELLEKTKDVEESIYMISYKARRLKTELRNEHSLIDKNILRITSSII